MPSEKDPALLLKRAQLILKKLAEEKIQSTPSPDFNRKLSTIRSVTEAKAKELKSVAPALTANVASTLLKVGFCQEFSQRFLLEYALKYRDNNIHLIFLANPKAYKANHGLVMLGPITVASKLVGGKKDTSVYLNFEDATSLEDFIKANQHAVFADPFLNCAGLISGREIETLFSYCKDQDLTHVTAVRSYDETPNFIKFAPTILANAEKIARSLNAERYRTIEYKQTSDSDDYLDRLQSFIGEKFVSKNPFTSGHVLFSIDWVKQLEQKAIHELATELGIDENKIKSLKK